MSLNVWNTLHKQRNTKKQFLVHHPYQDIATLLYPSSLNLTPCNLVCGCLFLCILVDVHMCKHVGGTDVVGAYTYGSQKLTSITLLIILCLIDLRLGLLLNLKLVDRARLAGSKPQGSSWICVSSSGIIVIHCHNWLLCQYCPLKSGPHTCAANT